MPKRTRSSASSGSKRRKVDTSVLAARVRFSSVITTHATFSPDEYDRTPAEVELFECDGCGSNIFGARLHCLSCDYDLCEECGPLLRKKHGHAKFELIAPEDESESESESELEEECIDAATREKRHRRATFI